MSRSAAAEEERWLRRVGMLRVGVGEGGLREDLRQSQVFQVDSTGALARTVLNDTVVYCVDSE